MNSGAPSGPGGEGRQGASGAGAWGSPIPGDAAPGPLGEAPRGQPRVRFSPQEAGRPYSPAVWRVQWRTEVRALVSGRVGLPFLRGGAFEGRRVSEGPACSPALNDRQYPKPPGGGWAAG